MADRKILDNGALATLGLVGVVAAVGAANQAGLYGSRSTGSGRYVVVSIHDGTDWGVFKASKKDIELGDDMSHAEAVETAKSAAASQKESRWYDFGIELAQTYTDKAGDRFFSGKSREENRMAAEAFASGLRAQVFTSPAFKRFLRSHPGAFRVSMMGEEAYVDQDVLLAYGDKDANVYVNTRQDAYRDLLESVANAHGYEIFD